MKLVILNNKGKQVVEIYNGKEYVIKTGENILQEDIAKAIRSRPNRGYAITEKSGENNVVCPLCGQKLPELEKKEQTSIGATSETIPQTVQVPVQPTQEKELSLSEKLDGLDKQTLINLCKRQGIQADARMTEETLRNKLKEIVK